MAIIQISKIQTRSGNLVDLPQLDNAEFGFASDQNRLFIGRTGNTISSENIEVLTSYSNISFSQIDGSNGGNFNVTNAQNGQILTYAKSTNTWENYTGQNTQLNGGKLQLGNVANINMGGGAIGYVLETDGLGNLSWTPKGTLYTPIKALSNANPIVMTVANTVPYVNGQQITISGVLGTNANSVVNGQSFYITLSNNYPTSGNVSLYTDVSRLIGANGATLTATANTGLATAVISGGGGGTGAASGTQNSVQYNNGGVLTGNTGFTFNQSTGALSVTGNVNTGNINSTGVITSTVLISNIATGTSPLTVTSTTRVANLNVAYSNVTDFTNITTATTGSYYPVLTNAQTGNVAQFANANLSFNAATGNLSATLLTGTLTTNAQPNITSLGTLTSLTVNGNTTSGNFIGIFANGTSNISISSSAGNINFGVAGNANILTVTGTGINVAGTINATGNISGTVFGPLANGNSNVRIATANGNVTISAVGNNIVTVTGTGVNVAGTLNTGSGNVIVGNLNASGIIIANTQLQANVATGTSPLVVLSSTQVPNLYSSRANVADTSTITPITSGTYYIPFISGTASANYGFNSNATFSANIANGAVIATTFVGNVSGTTLGGTLTTAAQPNITSTGTLTSLTVSGKSNLNSVGNVYISGGSANQILQTDGSGNLSWTNPTGGYYLHTQVSAATTWTVVHNLNRQYVTVEPIDGNGNSYVGRYDFPTINYTNANALTITFQSAVAGWAAVVGGGLNIGNVTSNYSPAGVNTQVQFNDAGNMAGSSGLVYNKNTGTLTATLFAGSGANLTNIAGANVTGTVSSATTAGTVTTAAQPNITSLGTLTGLGVNGTLTAVNITANSGLITGTLATNAQTNITSVGTLTSLAVTGNTTTGGIKTDNYYYANGVQISFAGAYSNSNVAAYLPTFTGTVGATALTTGANTTAGTITGNWSLSAGSRLNSTYADLAEYYEADAEYEPGTVLEFGGEREVTIAEDGTNRVAGVVSTDPAYAMNTTCSGIAVAIALQGRVPCKVRGAIKKGDMLVSGGNGYARPAFTPSIGTVIGKALENFEGVGIIEVAIGRL
jgi:hypothetical protein